MVTAVAAQRWTAQPPEQANGGAGFGGYAAETSTTIF
jgi:hypothetical protein